MKIVTGNKWILEAVLFLVATFAAGAHAFVTNSPKGIVKVQMHNVLYHFTEGIAVHIQILQGELVPANGNAIPVFDDKNSFTLRIAQAEIAITSASLANVLNSYVFAQRDAPIKNVSIHVENEELKVKGKLHSKGDISFELDGTVAVTGDGKIRIHPRTIKALHVPVKGLMDLFGIEVAGLIKGEKVPGVQAQGDDLILDPQRTLPPPHIEGKVAQVRLKGQEIVQIFGTPSEADIGAIHENYMQYRGNRLRFGKLTMDDTDLTLLDMNPQDPFDFYLDHYKEQLVAGYTKTTPSFGLRVYMRDYNKLVHRR
ncbi:MAG TPA: hypothetical protein VFA65_06895 [Bryobacteraceae bacterium]|nr:hypothetical protein [Bryobacteraceae bacterium]